MPDKRLDVDDEKPRRQAQARTTEGREKQLVDLAYDLAERQLIDGTASAQVITNFLKLGSEREKLEREKLRHENHLLETRAAQIESGARMEELYADAIKAMTVYQGREVYEDE